MLLFFVFVCSRVKDCLQTLSQKLRKLEMSGFNFAVIMDERELAKKPPPVPIRQN